MLERDLNRPLRGTCWKRHEKDKLHTFVETSLFSYPLPIEELKGTDFKNDNSFFKFQPKNIHNTTFPVKNQIFFT